MVDLVIDLCMCQKQRIATPWQRLWGYDSSIPPGVKKRGMKLARGLRSDWFKSETVDRLDDFEGFALVEVWEVCVVAIFWCTGSLVASHLGTFIGCAHKYSFIMSHSVYMQGSKVFCAFKHMIWLNFDLTVLLVDGFLLQGVLKRLPRIK